MENWSLLEFLRFWSEHFLLFIFLLLAPVDITLDVKQVLKSVNAPVDFDFQDKDHINKFSIIH